MNVKNIREQLLLTQKEFAEELSISINTVRTWEGGVSKPSFKNRRKILDLCLKHNIKMEEH